MKQILQIAATVVLVCCVALLVPALAGPSINSVNLAPALVAPGDVVYVTANVTDGASNVSAVLANEVPLSPTNNGNWEGEVPANSALGEHAVNIVAQNAAGETTTVLNAARYMTTVIYGVNGNHALHRITDTSSSKYLFRVWGKVKFIDENTFTVWDGSAYPVKVSSFGHSLADGDIVHARGILDGSNAPPALLRYGQYSIIKMAPRKAITIYDVTVGKDLQASDSGYLPTPVPYGGSLNVTISSTDPSKVVLSKSPTAAGSATIVLTVPGGSSNIPTFYVYGLASSGTVDIIATAPGGYGKIFKATLGPSGFGVSTGSINTTTFSSNSNISVRPARLNPTTLAVVESQPLRGGMEPVSVEVASSDTNVGAITLSPLTFSPNVLTQTTQFDPANAGTSTISIIQPAGFTTPTTGQSITATVTAPDIVGYDNAVGVDLQTSTSYYLSVAPPSPVDITVSVDSPAIATISKSATNEGADSLTFSGVGNTSSQTFYVHGRSLGTTTLTISAPGYNTRTRTITVTPSGFSIVTGNINTTTFATNSNVSVRPARLNPTTLAVVESQPLRGGMEPVSVEVASSDTNVGAITLSPLTFSPNVLTQTTQFDPANAGTSTISIIQPAGFTTPTTGQSITATVTAPDIVGYDNAVGVDLQTSTSYYLSVAPPSPVDITVSVDSPAIATISKSATNEGADSLTFSGVGNTNSQTFYVHGRSLGTTTLTISAPGYNTRTRTITVTPSGFSIVTGNINTTTFATNSNVSVRPARLNPTTLAVVESQPLRGGIDPVSVEVASSDTNVGAITLSPLTFSPNVLTQTTQFDPANEGTSTISIIQPAGFTTPTTGQSITATVTVPTITSYDSVVGRNLQESNSCYLSVAPPSPVDITVSVDSPAIATISKSATTEGTGSLVYSGVGNSNSQTFYVQGRSLGTTTLTISAPGYASRTRTITVDPSGFVIVNPTSITTTASAGNTNIQVRPARLHPTNFTYSTSQPLRGGLDPVSVEIISSNTSVGVITTSPLTFDPNITSLTTQFDPIAPGTTTISVEPPTGYSVPTTYRQITATVNP